VAEGDTVVLRETVTDSVANVRAFSSNTRQVPIAVPVNTVAPAITGTATEGQTLTRTTGTWTGYAPITYATQWRRGGVAISGATGATYVLVSADVGSTITCTVTATNTAGSASATSAATATVGASSDNLDIFFHGQSNTTLLFSATASPPAAAAGTSYWDGSAFTTVPSGNGIRAFCNTLRTLTGKNIRVADVSTPGAPSSYFASPNQGWIDFTDAYAAIGNVDKVVTIQGEGDADGVFAPGTRKPTYKGNWTTINAAYATLAGKPVQQFFGTLSTYGGSQAVIADDEWNDVQEGIRELCDENANIFLGCSRMDGTRTDVFHTDAASNERFGIRLAYAVAHQMGFIADEPLFLITAVERVSTTETDFLVTHSMGTDFTPTSGITGLRVKEGAGGSWVTPSAAVRISATRIRATHTAMGATTDRFGDYQYGTVPDITGIVLDNSALQIPLQLSAGTLLVDYANPAMTSSATFSTPENQTYIADLTATRPSTFSIGGTDAALFQIVAGDELHFVAAPNFEVPGDAGANNVYNITITPTAIDNSDVGTAQSVAVTVTDVSEGGGRSYSFLYNRAGNDGGTNTQSNSVDIGAAASDRYILVGLGVQNADPDPVVTVAGVTLTKLFFDTDINYGVGFYGGLVTTGNGAQNVVATWTSATFNVKNMAVWRLNGLTSTTPKQIVSGGGNMAVDAGDLVFHMVYSVGTTDDVGAGATEAPAREASFNTTGYSADWTIAATNAAFNFNHPGLSGRRVKISFA
jgi:hypothetical protein